VDDLDEGYAGPAEVTVAEVAHPVEVALSGRFEPVDGGYHWTGRTAVHPGLAGEVRAGRRAATIRIGTADPVPVRLAEVDPWGGVRLVGSGTPPWPAGPATGPATGQEGQRATPPTHP